MNRYLSMSNLFKGDTAFVAAIGATLGGVVDAIYGANHKIFVLLLFIFITYDWVSGIVAAKKDTTYSSQYGISGALRTIVVLSLPAVANLLDVAFNTPGVIFFGITFGLMYHYWQSFTANSIRAGWDKFIPEFVFASVESELKAKMNRAAQRQIPDPPPQDKGDFKA